MTTNNKTLTKIKAKLIDKDDDNEEKQIVCSECDKVFDEDDLKRIKETTTEYKDLCIECYENKVVICNNCNEEVWGDDSYRGVDGNLYCEDCFNDTFARCEGCGGLFYCDDLHYDDVAGYHCDNCWEDNESSCSDDDEIEIVKIHSGSFKTNKSKRFVGIEFEVEGGYFNRIDFEDNVKDSICVAEDGSLSNGCEVKTLPMNGDLLFDKIKSVTKQISEKGGYIATSCGLHVHFDVSDFQKKDLRKLFFVYKLFEEHFYSMVSGSRRENNYCKRLPFEIDRCLSAPTFKHYWYNYDWNTNLEECSYENCGENRWHNTRYFWVNLNSAYMSRNTMEIRLHQGSLDAEKVIKWIRIHLAIIEWCKNADLKRVIALRSGMSNFMNIIHDNDLKTYIRQRRKKFKYAKPRKIVNIKAILDEDTIVNKRTNDSVSNFFDTTWKDFKEFLEIRNNWKRIGKNYRMSRDFTRLMEYLYEDDYCNIDELDEVEDFDDHGNPIGRLKEPTSNERRVAFFKRYKKLIDAEIIKICDKSNFESHQIIIIKIDDNKIKDIRFRYNELLFEVWKRIYRRYNDNVRNTIFDEVKKQLN